MIPVFQVKDQMLVLRRRILILMNSGSLADRQLYFYPGRIQNYAVITRGGLLLIVAKPGPVTRAPICPIVEDQAVGWHQQYISIITYTGAAQVSMRKTVDVLIAIVITGTPIPTFQAGIRTELYHPKRHGCPGVSMAMSAGSNKGVDHDERIVINEFGCNVLLLFTTDKQEQNQQKTESGWHLV